MQTRIYIVLAVIVVTGCLLLFTASSVPLGTVLLRDRVSDSLEIRLPGSLFTGHRYFLGVKEPVESIAGGHWFWRVEHEDSLFQEFYDQPDPPFTAPYPGKYVFTAYADMHVVARDTCLFNEGERVEVDWPKGEPIVDGPLDFSDRSTGVRARRWIVLSGVDTLDRGDGTAFQWVPKKPGDHRVQLQLALSAGVDTVLEKRFEVAAKRLIKPAFDPDTKKKSDPKPKTDPKPKVDPKPIPERPVDTPPERPVAPPKKGECFSSVVDQMSRAAVLKVPMPEPKRADVEGKWSDSGTVFEVVPARDCQLASFSWWGNNNTKEGDATVSIECIAPCNGRKIRTKGFQISANYSEPGKQEFSFRSLPVLLANNRYRVTIKSDLGAKMGHFVLPQTSYKQDGFELIFSKPESGVFNITFRVK